MVKKMMVLGIVVLMASAAQAVILDVSGNGHDATLAPGASIVWDAARGSNVLQTTTGGGAATADIDFGGAYTGGYTLSAWYNTLNAGESWAALASHTGGGPRMFNQNGLGGLGAGQLDSNGWDPVEFGAGANSATDGQWHHMLITMDPSTGMFTGYLDGGNVGQKDRTGQGLVVNQNGPFVVAGIGSAGSTDLINLFNNSKLDDVALWPTAASASDAASIYSGAIAITDELNGAGALVAFDFVPEPASGLMALLGCLLLGITRRR